MRVSPIVGGLYLLKIIHADFFGLTQLLTWSGLPVYCGDFSYLKNDIT
ncbi:MAG: hypothetical protein ACXWTY_09825 [Methylobacter sp.]